MGKKIKFLNPVGRTPIKTINMNHSFKMYAKHLITCNLMQDWSEADDAFANTPNKFRDHEYYEAVKEMNTKRNTCTCGLDDLLNNDESANGGKEDEFVNKHLQIIMDKTLDSMIVTHIEKMWGGLQMASVQHFLETGKVSGSLHLRLKEFAKSFASNWHNTAAPSKPNREQNDKM